MIERTSIVCGAAILMIALVGMARGPDSQPARLPAKVDLAADFEKLGFSPRNQRDRGDCSLFAFTALAEFECAPDAGAAAPKTGLSPEFLVWAAHESTGARATRPCSTRRSTASTPWESAPKH
jgi:hypothetical protein